MYSSTIAVVAYSVLFPLTLLGLRLMLTVERLGIGEYLGSTRFERRTAGLLLTLSSYRPNQRYPWHVHANTTVFLLLRGMHYDKSGKHAGVQPPLTAAFHPVIEPHATEVGSDGMIGLNIEYPDDWLEAYGIRPRKLGGCRLLKSTATQFTALSILGTLFCSKPAVDAELETAAFDLIEPLITTDQPRDARPPIWFDRAHEFIRRSFREPITLRLVASESGVHPVYCARVFRRHLGYSVGEYLRRLRLIEAGRLIVEAGCPLIEAAMRAGFADQAHFTRCCSRTFGFAPSRLRVAYRAGQISS